MDNSVSKEWCTVAPISFFNFHPHVPPPLYIEKPFELGCGVTLRPVPDWTKKESAQQDLSLHQRGRINRGTYALIAEYQAASLGDPDLDWKGTYPRSKQLKAREGIALANLVLWMARPSGLGVDLFLHAEKSPPGWFVRQALMLSELIPHEQDQNASLTLTDLELARELNEALAPLPGDGAVWIAARALWKALTEEMWEVRYALLWMALEALFGPGDPHETTYRLSQYIAFFLATSKGEAKGWFSCAKKGYDWRSKIVHGMRLNKLRETKAGQIQYMTECFIRTSLKKILRDPELIATFSDENKRERYLENLIFSS